MTSREYYTFHSLFYIQIRAKVPFADGEWSKLVSVGKALVNYLIIN